MPAKLSSAAKDNYITQLVGALKIDRKTAQDLLTRASYNIELAVNLYYDKAESTTTSKGNLKKLNSLFARYAGSETESMMGIDGLIQWLEDLQLDPVDPVTLVIAHKCGAERTDAWPKAAWTNYWSSVNATTVEEQKKIIPGFRKVFDSQTEFAKLYSFVFAFAKIADGRLMLLDDAIQYWKMLILPQLEKGVWKLAFTPQHFVLWVEVVGQSGRNVSKDLWQQFWEFMRFTDAKFEKHDENAAWPSIIDDFVERVKLESAKKK